MNTQHYTIYTLLFGNHFPSFHNTQHDIINIKCTVFGIVLPFYRSSLCCEFCSLVVCYVQQYCNIYSLFGSHILTWIAMAKSFPSGWLSVRVLSRQSNITNGAPPNKSSIQWYDICSPVNPDYPRTRHSHIPELIAISNGIVVVIPSVDCRVSSSSN